MTKRCCVTIVLLLLLPAKGLADSVPNGFGKESCKLPELDPFDPRMMSLLDTGYNPMRNCTSTFKAYTRLVNGSVLVDGAALADGSHCKFRCLYPVDDYNYREGSWKDPESGNPDCDVVETNCWKENDTTPFLKDIHLQIYQQKGPSQKLPHSAPSVYWLIIDGVSTPQLIRSLPKTMHLLREDYGAIIFHHLNKIALNTPPNSRAMLLGKQMYDVIRFDPHDPTYKANLEPDFCQMDMIDSQFIGNLYRNAGYRTMIAEDWAQYAFNFLNCTGFKSPPADHYLKPFNLWLRGKEGFGRIALDSDFMRKRCKEVHEYVMDYFERFINAYPDEPKFSYVWLTEIAHTNPSCLFHLDDFTYEFFLEALRAKNRLRVKVNGVDFSRVYLDPPMTKEERAKAYEARAARRKKSAEPARRPSRWTAYRFR
ncbi:Protein T07G12.3 [Aphelenchoides avenae]|nr:Protein T07G12.3 [Aphelenchus avenae]